MRPADRLFQIVLSLGRGRVVTARTLADRLEVSERTIYRDIADLVATGVPIEGEAGVGYRLRSGYQIPPMMFDAEELEALVFGADVAKAYGDEAMAAAADRILDKVDAVIPERMRPQLSRSHLVVPGWFGESAADNLGELRGAINAHRRILIDYADADGEITERIIWPLVLLYWGRVWTLGGWCELRAAFRTFRIDRIETLRTLTSRFPDQEGRRQQDYLRASGSRDSRQELSPSPASDSERNLTHSVN